MSNTMRELVEAFALAVCGVAFWWFRRRK